MGPIFRILTISSLVVFLAACAGAKNDSPAIDEFSGSGDHGPFVDELYPSLIRLQPDPLQAQNGFGKATALSTDRAVITGSGFANVYNQDVGRSWTRSVTLTPPVAIEDFGRSVSLDERRIAIGALGKVFVFEEDNNHQWNADTIEPREGKPSNAFGEKLQIQDNWLIVAQPDPGSGATYVFEQTGANWDIAAGYEGSSQEGCVGQQLAVAQNTVLVGDTRYTARDANGHPLANSGQICTYDFNGAAGFFYQIIRPQNPQAQERFGESVAVSQGVVITGAPGVKKAFIYEYNLGHWELRNEVSVPGTSAFGELVGLYQGKAIVQGRACAAGAPADCGGIVTLYFFTRSAGGQWELSRTLPLGLETPASSMRFFASRILLSLGDSVTILQF